MQSKEQIYKHENNQRSVIHIMMNEKSWIRVHIYCIVRIYIDCVQNDQITKNKFFKLFQLNAHKSLTISKTKNQLYYYGVGVIAMFVAMTNTEIVILSIFCFLTSRVSPNNSVQLYFSSSNRIVT